MTTHTTLPQVSLPGQAHVAEGPHDQTGMYVIHHAFRRDLARFEAAVRRTPLADDATWAALERRWHRFAEILHHHHTVEDEHFWPVLERRVRDGAPDPAPDLTLLADMAAEHAVIDPHLERCATGFALMRSRPSDDHRNALDVHVTAARAALDAHLAHEETGALPLLQRYATAADVAAMEAGAERAYPARLLPFLLPWVVSGLPDDVRDRILATAGPPGRVALALFKGRFQHTERKAFGHV